MSFFQQIKDFLYLPTRIRNGYFILLVILMLVILIPVCYRIFFQEASKSDFSMFINDIKQFEQKLSTEKQEPVRQEISFENPELSAAKLTIKPFPFNPNNLPAEDWKKMGFTEAQIRTIKKYEAAGGSFTVRKDLKKLYAITDEVYEVLYPFILLPDTLAKIDYKKKSQEKNISTLELNSADTMSLKTLPGIGSYYAKAIIKYREKLGGYFDKFQLLEVWNFDTARFMKIEKYLEVDPFLIKKININTATFELLKQHPYISPNVAISLINYRNVHGNYMRIEDVKKSVLVTNELYNKLAPYLKTEN